VASLTPRELQEARRRSGKLGGRPRKLTRDEAREAALDELVPCALRVLRLHLGDNAEPNPLAWKAALAIFPHAFGRPAQQMESELTHPRTIEDVDRMSLAEIRRLRAVVDGDGQKPSG
jgi:hypothetical protein